jgi:hypothetical protein
VADSNLLYVGLTWAMESLVLTWTGRSKFTDRVTPSFNAVPLGEEADWPRLGEQVRGCWRLDLLMGKE